MGREAIGTPTPAVAAEPVWVRRARQVLALVALAVAVGCVAWRIGSGDLIWLMWADRDLMRASVDWAALPTAGAELSYGMGARVPGGGLYWLIHATMMLRDDPVFIWRVMLGLDVLAMSLLGWLVWRVLTAEAAALAVASWAVSPIVFDTLRTLWNPGYLSLFVSAGTVAVLWSVHTRSARWLPWGMVALAVGAQLHLTAASLAAVLGVCVLVARPAGWAKALAVSALGAVLAYAPYLWSEWRDGAPNLQAMRAQSQVGNLLDPLAHGTGGRNLASIAQLLGGLVLPVQGGEHDLSRAWLPWLACQILPLVAALSVLWVVSHPRRVGTLWVAVAVVVAGVAYFLLDPAIDMTVSGSGRYLLVIVPSWSLLSAWGVASSGTWLGRRRAWVGLIPWLLATVSIVAQAWAWQGRFESDTRGFWRYGRMVSALDGVAEATDSSLADVSGRTMLWFRDGKGVWMWRVSDGIDDLLRRRGEVFPGSLAPPCALLLLGRGHSPPEPVTADEIAARLAQPLPNLTVLDSTLIGSDRLVRYTHDGAHCHTTMTDRYVLSPEEELTADALRRLSPGAAERVLDSGTHSRWVAVLDGARVPGGSAQMPLGVTVDVVSSGDGVVVGLASNQLRGRAWNSGFFSAAMVADPAILLEQEGRDPVRWVIADGYVGGAGVMTPLHTAPQQVGPGSWSVALVGEMVSGFDEANWPPETPVTRTPFRVDLPGGLRVAEEGRP